MEKEDRHSAIVDGLEIRNRIYNESGLVEGTGGPGPSPQ